MENDKDSLHTGSAADDTAARCEPSETECDAAAQLAWKTAHAHMPMPPPIPGWTGIALRLAYIAGRRA